MTKKMPNKMTSKSSVALMKRTVCEICGHLHRKALAKKCSCCAEGKQMEDDE